MDSDVSAGRATSREQHHSAKELAMHVSPMKVRWVGATAIAAALVAVSLAVPPSGAEAGVVGADLVSNGGFENGVAPWTSPDGGVLSTDTELAASGAASLKVTERTRTSSGPWQDVGARLTPGSAYDISATVRFDSGPDTKEFILTMAYSDQIHQRRSCGRDERAVDGHQGLVHRSPRSKASRAHASSSRRLGCPILPRTLRRT